MATWLVVLILAIVEGITEFIPVSSTGHLLITAHFLPAIPLSLRQNDLFLVVIQGGAVLAVLPLFKDRLKMLSHLRQPRSQTFLAKIIVACIVTGIPGFIMEKKGFKLPEHVEPVAWALLIGGVIFIAVETLLRGKRTTDQISWAVAIAVGIGQLIAALLPGASRSGSTIMFALILGVARPAATEFSFLVGIPTMLAATALKLFKALHHPVTSVPSEDWAMLLLGTVVAAIVSFIAVKWLLRFVQSHTFIGFGIYRIVVGGLLLILLFMRLGFGNEAPEDAHPAALEQRSVDLQSLRSAAVPATVSKTPDGIASSQGSLSPR
jgi:undecaprenyl-diphosphatase